jgi:hypothetical protein
LDEKIAKTVAKQNVNQYGFQEILNAAKVAIIHRKM